MFIEYQYKNSRNVWKTEFNDFNTFIEWVNTFKFFLDYIKKTNTNINLLFETEHEIFYKYWRG